MFRHILFPTDGSALSRRAAKVAVQMARKHNARLTAFHVIPLYVPAVFPDAGGHGLPWTQGRGGPDPRKRDDQGVDALEDSRARVPVKRREIRWPVDRSQRARSAGA